MASKRMNGQFYICFDDSKDLLSGQHLSAFCNWKLHECHVKRSATVRSQSFVYLRWIKWETWQFTEPSQVKPSKQSHSYFYRNAPFNIKSIRTNRTIESVDDKRKCYYFKKSNARLPNECSIIIVLTSSF